ncbi:phage baseplate assembly protein domain-containing protein [Xenorhabdus cabanillasii]|uniref:phage baseplate assembly protein domain-containing protein n=1 Tax=Xenorhabdus cabanillasii TaxID=351673 RepID=UPI001E54358C|nr:phage baseplate assembly protein [Xenorhabdus cabanillasii]
MVSFCQEFQTIIQVSLLAEETADDVERFQNYGYTSVPPAGSVRQHLGHRGG